MNECIRKKTAGDSAVSHEIVFQIEDYFLRIRILI